jgi:hypothetical protein
MGTSGASSDITAGILSLGHVGVTAKCASDDELIGLMLGHPMVTNRPIVVTCRAGLFADLQRSYWKFCPTLDRTIRKGRWRGHHSDWSAHP